MWSTAGRPEHTEVTVAKEVTEEVTGRSHSVSLKCPADDSGSEGLERGYRLHEIAAHPTHLGNCDTLFHLRPSDLGPTDKLSTSRTADRLNSALKLLPLSHSNASLPNF